MQLRPLASWQGAAVMAACDPTSSAKLGSVMGSHWMFISKIKAIATDAIAAMFHPGAMPISSVTAVKSNMGAPIGCPEKDEVTLEE